ncbi:MAG: hypothetical protein AAF517_21160, partial [Planctomycetota bacterium]
MKRSKRIRIVIGTALVLVVAGLFSLDYYLETRWGISAVISILGLAGFWEFGKMASLTSKDARGVFCVGLLGTAYFLGLACAEGVYGELRSEFHVGG